MGEKITLKTEQAVDQYVHLKLQECKDDLLKFMDEMQASHGSTFQPTDQSLTGMEFLLARLAIDCHHLWRLFPDEKANEIFRLIFSKYLKFDGFSDQVVADKLFGYMDILDEMQKTDAGPLSATFVNSFAETFLKTVLGKNIETFYITTLSNSSVINPLVLSQASNVLFNYKISWRAIAQTAVVGS